MTLTQYELLIIKRLASGLSASELAKEMSLPPETLGARITTARNRVGAKNTTHLCVMAAKEGLV